MTPFLSLRPEGEGADVRLLFHNQPTGGARALSGTVVHEAAALTLLLVAQWIPQRFYEAVLPQRLPKELVFLVDPGPGGGGGGNKSPKPPPPAQLKGPDQITVPTLTLPDPQLEPVNIEPPPEPAAIAAQPMAGAIQTTTGVPLGTAAPGSSSRGPGATELEVRRVPTVQPPLKPQARFLRPVSEVFLLHLASQYWLRDNELTGHFCVHES